ncbi:helicase-related protein [Acetobacter vaccinii]|uniref:DNA helicase n=1 Tax=Acetobacter vaccinii TaxID=2592655 RepID=A0A5C1YNB8_9PROT|nr:helicase-related protein [Acetobacter vaccinii]QEO16975.1 DNA helicase [Acetobacter vaccinii]
MKASARQSPARSPGQDSTPDAPVRAILGPTNTGKTHLALERMLAHASGMIGFPLRLLARENYERMVRLKGVRAVALITGEEKIVPPQARWFSCTVEAMPMDRPVDFMAVDEIQLCADPERGHIFTDRLLNARGQAETLFLGADTIAPLMKTLIKGVEIETRPRLSNLTCTGHNRLSRLPARSAIVAFSVGEVYAIAELIRRKRGGCAVVMGQLSPRTRNAQVALYQNREVDYLVATDAIGMGLNMDIHHVAFAGLAKFDGQQHRLLRPAEVAQIAGRAGRGARDGTFGTTGECPPFPDGLVDAVEEHRFDPLPFLWWRNSTLDFSSVDALYASLCAKSPHPSLRPAEPATDLLMLHTFLRDSTLRALAQGREKTRLLWEVCQIPDFRKLGEDSHIRQCEQIFTLLARKGRLPADWFKARLHGLDQTQGDMEALMQRLMGIRIWSYVAARPGWVEQAEEWQRHTRMLEDTLSDALHERLTTRFVDRRAASLARRLEEADSKPLLSAMNRAGEISVEGHPVGRMHGFAFQPDPETAQADQPLILRAARRAARSELPRLVARFLHAPDTELELDTQNGHILWQEAQVGLLRPGPNVVTPIVHVRDAEFLDSSQKDKVHQRLAAFIQAHIRHDLAPLYEAEAAVAEHPALRGLVHILMEHGGVAPCPVLPPLSRAQQALLSRLHIQHDTTALFCTRLFRPQAMALRRLLLGLAHGQDMPALPPAGTVSTPLPAPPDRPQRQALLAMGWVCAGPALLRLDIATTIRQELRDYARQGPRPLPVALPSRLGVSKKNLPSVLLALGVPLRLATSLPRTQPGPPAPCMILPPPPVKKQKKARAFTPDRPKPGIRTQDSPFAILASLRGHL